MRSHSYIYNFLLFGKIILRGLLGLLRRIYTRSHFLVVSPPYLATSLFLFLLILLNLSVFAIELVFNQIILGTVHGGVSVTRQNVSAWIIVTLHKYNTVSFKLLSQTLKRTW